MRAFGHAPLVLNTEAGGHLTIPVDPPRILVLGASGGLGLRVCEEVVRQFPPGALLVGDYRPDRGNETANRFAAGFVSVDIRDIRSIRDALAGVTAVVVAVQQSEPQAQIACIEAGVPCLDVAVGPGHIARVHSLDAPAKAAGVCIVILAGLFPGLSGVMAQHALSMLDDVKTLDVALCQNSDSSAGATGIADMLGLLAQPVTLWRDGREVLVPGFTRRRKVTYPAPFGEKTHRLVNFIEGDLVRTAARPSEVNFWTGYDKVGFNRLLATLNTLGILALFNRPRLRQRLARWIDNAKSAKQPKTEPCAVVAEAAGTKDGNPSVARVSLLAPSDYGTTAMSVVATARLLLDRTMNVPGVHCPFQIIEFHALIDAMGADDLEFFETLQ